MLQRPPRAALSLLLSLAFLAVRCAAIETVNFADVSPAAPDQVVLFIKQEDDSGEEVLHAVLETEEFLQENGGGNITFKMVDASNPVNAKAMAAKGLLDFPMLFVSIAGQGMGDPPDLSQAATLPTGCRMKIPRDKWTDVFNRGRSLPEGDHLG
jgi:hypothetical protein